MDNRKDSSLISHKKARSTVKNESAENSGPEGEESRFEGRDADEFITIEYPATYKQLFENGYLIPEDSVDKTSVTVHSALSDSTSIPEGPGPALSSPASRESVAECKVGIGKIIDEDSNDVFVITDGEEDIIEISDDNDDGESSDKREKDTDEISPKTKVNVELNESACPTSCVPLDLRENSKEDPHKRKCEPTQGSAHSQSKTKRMKVVDDESIQNEVQPHQVTPNESNSKMSKLLERELAEKMIQRMLERKTATANLKRLKSAEVALARQLVRQIMRPNEASGSKPANRARTPVGGLNARQRNQAETALATQMIQQLEKEDVTSLVRSDLADNGGSNKRVDLANATRANLAEASLPLIHRSLKGGSNPVVNRSVQTQASHPLSSAPQCAVHPMNRDGDLVIEERMIHWTNHPLRTSTPRPTGSVHPSYVVPPTYREALIMNKSGNSITPLSSLRYDHLLPSIVGPCPETCRTCYISPTYQPNHCSNISNERSPTRDRGSHPGSSAKGVDSPHSSNPRSSFIETIKSEEVSLRQLMYLVQRRLEMLRWLRHDAFAEDAAFSVPVSTPGREDKNSESLDKPKEKATK